MRPAKSRNPLPTRSETRSRQHKTNKEIYLHEVLGFQGASTCFCKKEKMSILIYTAPGIQWATDPTPRRSGRLDPIPVLTTWKYDRKKTLTDRPSVTAHGCPRCIPLLSGFAETALARTLRLNPTLSTVVGDAHSIPQRSIPPRPWPMRCANNNDGAASLLVDDLLEAGCRSAMSASITSPRPPDSSGTSGIATSCPSYTTPVGSPRG